MFMLADPSGQTQIRGRYAPSPTGDLHLGNLRTALLAWLFARGSGGQFVLRIEDLDQPRVKSGATERMINDLRWLGLDWDEGPDCDGSYAPYIQSERTELYEYYLTQLQAQGLVYPCYCSRAELLNTASAPQEGASDGPRYPGTCRFLSTARKQELVASGRRPSLRFHVEEQRTISFVDLLAGPITQNVQQAVGDFILRRSDGIFAYQFAVVIDDALMHLNQIIRGYDLLSSTPRQILLYETLGFPVPTFGHVPLLLDATGKRLSKRSQSEGLSPLRAAGQTAEKIVGQLAASCQLVEPGTVMSAGELARRYSTQTYGIMRPKLPDQ